MMVNKVTIVGYANKSNLYVDNWLTSLRRQKFHHQLIGQGDKWQGLFSRIQAYYDYLSTQSDNNIYVFLDVYDVVAVGCSQDIINWWSKQSVPIVIGAEPNCNPNLCRPKPPICRYSCL